jgi:type I site-specific restriction-modification system R (restriction) subunit
MRTAGEPARLLDKELTGLVIVNEPAQVECGAPDFVALRNKVPIGHIEAKDLGVPLDEVAESEQLRRYRAGLPNLLLTNYVDFVWFVEGEERRRVTIAKRGKAKTALIRSSAAYPDLEALFGEFAAEVSEDVCARY